jgi:hypothetical protein
VWQVRKNHGYYTIEEKDRAGREDFDKKRLVFIFKAASISIINGSIKAHPMFVEGLVRYSAMFTYLDRWHAGAVSLPPSDVMLAQLACPLSDVMFCLH